MLIVVGDYDFVRVEHPVETAKLIPNAELAGPQVAKDLHSTFSKTHI